jgi:hypothetical protein
VDTHDEKQGTLQQLSDPALLSPWSTTRVRVALGDSGSKPRYDAVRAEYERRMGGAS